MWIVDVVVSILGIAVRIRVGMGVMCGICGVAVNGATGSVLLGGRGREGARSAYITRIQ